MSDSGAVQGLFEEVVELATRAGEATLPLFNSSRLAVDRKADGTPVTDADRAAERLIRDHLERHHPSDNIVGEEEGTAAGDSDRTWFIDPIDGTRSFVHGVPLYSTLVAVYDGDGPVAGAIALPALGEIVAAGRGLGCVWNGVSCSVSDTASIDGAVLSRSEYGHTPSDMQVRLDGGPLSLRTWGDGFGYVLAATGRIDAMLDPFVHPWDIAPMPVIFEEAGGRFTSLDGLDGMSGGSGLATNGVLHDDIRAVVTGA